MRKLSLAIAVVVILAAPILLGAKTNAPDEQSSIVIVFKDGTQKTFSMADIARIEFNSGKKDLAMIGQGRFLGKWKVGIGGGSMGTFMITLDKDGQATKSLGGSHGRWVVVDGEARITWDDGWHDSIRRHGNKYEKVAYGPGKTFSDDPDSVAGAEHTEASPI
jgi:hypothetical protein